MLENAKLEITGNGEAILMIGDAAIDISFQEIETRVDNSFSHHFGREELIMYYSDVEITEIIANQDSEGHESILAYLRTKEGNEHLKELIEYVA